MSILSETPKANPPETVDNQTPSELRKQESKVIEKEQNATFYELLGFASFSEYLSDLYF